ncbi:MAG: helix-turn-helix transcriptional regulator [Patescibacteria group bacterium]
MPQVEVTLLTGEMTDLLVKCVKTSKLNQKELAEKAGVQQSWLSRLLRGDRHRLEVESINKVVGALAKTLDTMGAAASNQATYLREVFFGDVLNAGPMSAVKKMAVIGLMKCGLGIDADRAGEMFDSDPCLMTKVQGAIQVLKAIEAIINAIPDSLKDAAVGEMITSGIEDCGFGTPHDVAREFCKPDAKEKIQRAVSALSGVSVVIEIARGEDRS